MQAIIHNAGRAVAALAFFLVAAPSLAQDQDKDLSIEEILVTAQKREQSLQDVPIAITAFDTNTIERAGIREFTDYARMGVPLTAVVGVITVLLTPVFFSF